MSLHDKEHPVQSQGLENSSAPLIVCDRGTTDRGDPYWLYLLVNPEKYEEYMRLTAEHTLIRFEDYGTILKYGYGKEIPESVRQEIREEYDYDDSYRDVFIQNAKPTSSTKQQADGHINDIVAMLKNKTS